MYTIREESCERLLSDEKQSIESDVDSISIPTTTPKHDRHNTYKGLAGVLAVLAFILLNNVTWIVLVNVKDHHQAQSLTSPTFPTTYPPYSYIDSPFHQHTTYSDSDADDLWRSLFPLGNGVLSLTTSEANQHGLAPTAPDPLRPDHGVYIVSGYHSLHCLTVLRTALGHFHRSENQTAPWSHLVHCLDQVRQTLMCRFDTTLLAAVDEDHFVDGQPHVCVDYWGIHGWMTAHAG